MATRAPRAPSKTAVGTLAPMIVGTANFCVVTTFGANCGLTDMEGRLLIPSMQRMLERMPAQAASRAAVVIDPLIMLTVVVMWGKRIAAIKSEEARQKYQVQPMEQARANGIAGTAYSVPNESAKEETNAQPNGVIGNAEGNSYGAPQHMREAFDDRF